MAGTPFQVEDQAILPNQQNAGKFDYLAASPWFAYLCKTSA